MLRATLFESGIIRQVYRKHLACKLSTSCVTVINQLVDRRTQVNPKPSDIYQEHSKSGLVILCACLTFFWSIQLAVLETNNTVTSSVPCIGAANTIRRLLFIAQLSLYSYFPKLTRLCFRASTPRINVPHSRNMVADIGLSLSDQEQTYRKLQRPSRHRRRSGALNVCVVWYGNRLPVPLVKLHLVFVCKMILGNLLFEIFPKSCEISYPLCWNVSFV